MTQSSRNPDGGTGETSSQYRITSGNALLLRAAEPLLDSFEVGVKI